MFLKLFSKKGEGGAIHFFQKAWKRTAGKLEKQDSVSRYLYNSNSLFMTWKYQVIS